jgi:hypothetical protein
LIPLLLVVHEVDEVTKCRALDFVRDTLAPQGAFYIVDRFRLDLRSPLAEDHAALWESLHTSPLGGLSWAEYRTYMEAKLDDAWASPQACVALCRRMGFHAEVLYTAFNRFIVAARPRANSDSQAEIRRDFESWRDAKLAQLGFPEGRKPSG